MIRRMTQDSTPPLDYGTDERGLIETFQSNPRLTIAAGVAAIVLATLVAYVPAIRGQFIWDDDYYVTNNVLLQNLDGLQRTWFDIVPAPSKYPLPQYYPMTHTSFWFEHRIWGLNPTGYHITNVLLHICNALLIWLILKRLDVPGSWAAAAIFALHPINVESVAWIAERKNVLCGFFFFSSLYIYLRYCGVILKPRAAKEYFTLPDDPLRVYGIALLLFALALASKTIASSMPVVVLLVIWWKRGRISFKDDVVPLLPFFALGIAAGALTGWMEVHNVGARGADWEQGLVARGLIAGRVAWFYVGKLIFPYPLIFNYPRWEIRTGDPVQWIFLLAAVAVVVILWTCRKQWGRGPLVAVLYYLGTLVPAMGFVNVFPMRYSFVADHFVYLSSIGLIALASAGMSRLLSRFVAPQNLVGASAGAAAVVLVACFVLTNSHAGVFESPHTLWKDTLTKTDQKSWMAANNYGELLLRSRDPENIAAAEKWFEKVLRLKPEHAEARYNLGLIAELRGENDVAMNWYAESTERRNNDVRPVYRLGRILESLGRIDEAEKQYQRVVQINPADENAYLTLGLLYEKQKKYEEAIKQYEAASDANPDSAAPFIAIGTVLVNTNKIEESLPFFGRALQLDRENPTIARNIGAIFASSGYLREARDWLTRAIDLNPNFADARRQLGVVLALQGLPDEARKQFEEALRIDPAFEQAKANLLALDEGRLKPATTQSTQPSTLPATLRAR
jgi:tetratricopeptide (TPR) repeat protein